MTLKVTDSVSDLQAIVRKWSERTQNFTRCRHATALLGKKWAPFGKTIPHLMTSAEDGERLGRNGLVHTELNARGGAINSLHPPPLGERD